MVYPFVSVLNANLTQNDRRLCGWSHAYLEKNGTEASLSVGGDCLPVRRSCEDTGDTVRCLDCAEMLIGE